MSLLQPIFPTLSVALGKPKLLVHEKLKHPLRKKELHIKLHQYYQSVETFPEQQEISILSNSLKNYPQITNKFSRSSYTSQSLKRIPKVFKEFHTIQQKLEKFRIVSSKNNDKIQPVQCNDFKKDNNLIKTFNDSKSFSSDSRSSKHIINPNSDKKSDDSRQFFVSQPLDLKNIELKTSEGNHIINEYLYNEEIIVKEINANIKVNQIMHPIFDNLMLEKKEYDRLKHLNNQKEFKLGILIKSLMEIELNENFENKRKRINEIKDLIKIEKENIFKVNCQTNILNFMLNSRKNDLILKKQPVIKALKRAPKLTEKTENEIENLNTKIKALNQIYLNMKRIDKEEKSYLKLANKLEDEKEITQKNEYWINNLIEKEKELKVISLERVKEEKRIELAGKELKKEQDHELRKQKYEDLFKNLQTLKDDIFHLRSYTGHSIQETEINQSVMNFKNTGANLFYEKDLLEKKIEEILKENESYKIILEDLKLHESDPLKQNEAENFKDLLTLEKKRDFNYRETQNSESKVNKTSELVASCVKGFIDVYNKILANFQTYPLDLQKKIRNLQKITTKMNFLEFSQDIAEIIDNINNSNSLENKSEDFLSPENLFPSYKKSIIDSQAKINKIHNFDNDLKANQTKNSRNFLENSKEKKQMGGKTKGNITSEKSKTKIFK